MLNVLTAALVLAVFLFLGAGARAQTAATDIVTDGPGVYSLGLRMEQVEPGVVRLYVDKPDGSLSEQFDVVVGSGVNMPPVAADDIFEEPSGFTVNGNVLANDGDPDGSVVAVFAVNDRARSIGVPVTLPSGALLTMTVGGDFTWDPNGLFADGGTDTFTYTVGDGSGGAARATVTITEVAP